MKLFYAHIFVKKIPKYVNTKNKYIEIVNHSMMNIHIYIYNIIITSCYRLLYFVFGGVHKLKSLFWPEA